RPPQPTSPYRSTANNRAIKWVLAITGIFFAALAGFITLYYIGYDTGLSALMVGILFATLPIPIYILLILWIDRYESEPLWMLAMAFFWGATFAAFMAITINSQIAISIARAYDLATGFYYLAVASAPIVEEFSKGLVLFILFWWKNDEFDGIIDGFVYAGMVGLGFAMTENFKYYGEAALMGGKQLTGLFILRGAVMPFAHPLFTSMTGIGLGIAKQTRSRALKVIMPVLGLLLAMFLHFVWNFSYVSGVFLVVYVLFMVPVFAGAIVSIVFALRREGRIVREHLWYDCQRGLFSPDEFYRLCSIQGRMSASYRALRWGGFRLWRTRMKFNQAASELAFHRSRQRLGRITDPRAAYEREMAYVNHLFELRRQLGPF
ncbi:MAG TPA: PrsW family intramembrane metalloprotease, partial [Pyrinomonadaceae bacterium]|nr:PrsW family intramembrane metalloprotease [Pyrinomonadaceae bacterium]